MEVLFAPDWRETVPYQRLLAEALHSRGVRVSFLQGSRHGLPLTRLTHAWREEHRCQLLHLHFPEAYFARKGDGLDWLRALRFPLDLRLATRGLPLVVTAHNLHPHDRRDPLTLRNTRAAMQRARVVFAHSPAAAEFLRGHFALPEKKVRVIPGGDTTAELGPPLSRLEARLELGLGSEKICLMFGALEPYKGLEEAIAYWRRAAPECHLHLAGRPRDEAYAATLARLAQGCDRVHLHPGWMSPETLRAWLSAVDCVLFNYRAIFYSGAAPTARAYGLPILLPARLPLIELGEPSLSVIRFADFQNDFALRLHQALSQKPDYPGAAPWRAATSWAGVAEATLAGYRAALL